MKDVAKLNPPINPDLIGSTLIKDLNADGQSWNLKLSEHLEEIVDHVTANPRGAQAILLAPFIPMYGAGEFSKMLPSGIHKARLDNRTFVRQQLAKKITRKRAGKEETARRTAARRRCRRRRRRGTRGGGAGKKETKEGHRRGEVLRMSSATKDKEPQRGMETTTFQMVYTSTSDQGRHGELHKGTITQAS